MHEIYFQGNSSVCDHIEVAEIYIKDLEKSIKELQDKREKLQNSLLSDQIPNIIGRPSLISSVNPIINDNYVKIKVFSKELEIEINAMVEEDGVFPLSKVLKVVQLEEGLTIVNCAYSKVNQRWVHVIRCEVLLSNHLSNLFFFDRNIICYLLLVKLVYD